MSGVRMIVHVAGRRILSVSAAAEMLSGIFMGGPVRADSCSGPCYDYAGVWSSNLATGIDGYIRGSTTVSISSPWHRANWINLCRLSCQDWVQTGVVQG